MIITPEAEALAHAALHDPEIKLYGKHLQAILLDRVYEYLFTAMGELPPSFYHYTGSATPGFMWGSAEWYASHYTELNDEAEVVHLRDVARAVFADDLARLPRVAPEVWKVSGPDDAADGALFGAFDHRLVEMSLPDPYIISLSTLSDDSQQWQNYAERGGGVCLKVGRRDLMKLLDSRKGPGGATVQVVPVFYKREEQRKIAALIIGNALDVLRCTWGPAKDEHAGVILAVTSGIIASTLSSMGVLCKHRGFRSEREWRVIIPGPREVPAGEWVSPAGAVGVTFGLHEPPGGGKLRRKAHLRISRGLIKGVRWGPLGEEPKRAALDSLTDGTWPSSKSNVPLRKP